MEKDKFSHAVENSKSNHIISGDKQAVDPPSKTLKNSIRFLCTTITQDLKMEPNISSLIKKAQQRMDFLQQLRKAKLPVQMMVQFYMAIIESILTSSITGWYVGVTDFHLGRTCTSPGLCDEQVGSLLTLLTLDMVYLNHSPQAGGYGPSGPEPPATRIVSLPLPLVS